MTRVAVVGTPRSGNTWVRSLLAAALEADSRIAHHPDEVDWNAMSGSVVLQLHWLPTDHFLATLANAGMQVVTVTRHPFDVLVSILQYVSEARETSRWLAGDGGDESGIIGATPVDPAFLDYATSERARALLAVTPRWLGRPETVGVSYEDLLQRPVKSLTDLLTALDASVERVEWAVEASSLHGLRRRYPDRTFHFWRGSAGTWRDVLTPAVVTELVATHEGVLDATGYSADPSHCPEAVVAERNWYRLRLASAVAQLEDLRALVDELADDAAIGRQAGPRVAAERGIGPRSMWASAAVQRLVDLVRGRRSDDH